ncbi:serine/threonine protein kinase [Pendulispora albinea]|uniref:non-specific serine/threonine protein kinase n=2 Tax=Pendulispora albinea TaxID=2741071 RepID=A0ABZ2LQB2_9BACT
MATIYLAISRGLGGFNKLVVLKQLRPDIAGDPQFLSMLLEEARIAARIQHPNVVQTNEIGFDGNAHYIAMEYLEGQSLSAITRRLADQGQRLPLPMYLHILSQALCGLHYAHELTDYGGAPLSIVHRDMTPHNVFVTYDGTVKVLDFGIAKAADSRNETRSGTFKGKLRYVAPEQALGIPIDRRADIFAIGAMMWHAIANAPMWRGVSETDVLMQLARGDIPDVAEVAPSTPPELLDICRRALAAKPAARFASAAAMMDALESFPGRAPVSPRELGQFVGQLFDDRRTLVRNAIDQRMRESRSGTDIPVLSTSSVKSITAAQPPASVPSLSGARSVSFTATPSAAQIAPTGATSASNEAPASSFSRYAIGAAVGLLVASLGFGMYAVVGQKNVTKENPPMAAAAGGAAANAAAGPAHAGAGAAPMAASTAEAPKSRVRITVVPASANIRLDGVPFSGNGQLPRDGASHRLEIDAPGFKPESDYVVFDRDDFSLTYTLAKNDPPAPRYTSSKSKDVPRASDSANAAASAQGAPSSSASSAGQVAAGASSSSLLPPAHSKHKPKTSLDSTDPWK